MRFSVGRAGLVLFFSIIINATLSGQLSIDTLPEYLESGELSYTININFSSIAWKSEAEYTRDIEKAWKELQRKPDEHELVIAYIETCQRAGRHESAQQVAEEYFEAIHQAYREWQDETTARRFVVLTNLTGPREAQITAYETIRPFLELGDAEIETVYAALHNRELLGDYHLGFRIAEFYQKIYPYEPELYFRGFLMTLNNSLYKTIPFMINAIHERMNSMDTFLLEYYRALEDSIYLDLLDKAVELDPDNYKYLLASVGFRSLVRWFSQLSTMMVEDDVTLSGIQELFTALDLRQDETLTADLQKALRLRPKHDSQIFLAAALFQATVGDLPGAFAYVEKALVTRSDLSEGYDAKIFLSMLSMADQDGPPTPEQRREIESILTQKMERCGKIAYDLYVLAALRMLTLREGTSAIRRRELISEMEGYAEESIAVKDTILGRLALGNAYLLQNRLGEAVTQYEYAINGDPQEMEYAVRANLGVAYLLQGRRQKGIEEITAAMELAGETVRAADLVEK